MTLAKIGFTGGAGKSGSIRRHQGGKLRLRLWLRLGAIGPLGHLPMRAYAERCALASPTFPSIGEITPGATGEAVKSPRLLVHAERALSVGAVEGTEGPKDFPISASNRPARLKLEIAQGEVLAYSQGSE